jgi:radical SAM superfamily enzyme YgiQ (UPF0313 family)
VEKNILDTLKSGIDVIVGAIIGFPYETEKYMRTTVKGINKLKSLDENIKTILSYVYPMPGSLLWQRYKRGHLGIFRLKNEKLKNSRALPKDFFTEKYNHLPWVVPDEWLFKNEKIPQKDLERLICEYRNELSA